MSCHRYKRFEEMAQYVLRQSVRVRSTKLLTLRSILSVADVMRCLRLRSRVQSTS